MYSIYKLGRTSLIERVVELLTEDKYDYDDAYTTYLKRLYILYLRSNFDSSMATSSPLRIHQTNFSQKRWSSQRGVEAPTPDKQEAVELEDMLLLDQADRKVILVEGASGISRLEKAHLL